MAALLVAAAEVGQQLHAEADVPLLVGRHSLHAGAEAGKEVALLEVARDEVLAGLGERRLDDDVIERDRRRQVGARGLAAQPRAHRSGATEPLGKPPREVRLDGGGARAGVVAADARHLVHEAAEEHGVARLVHLLRGQEVLLLLERRRVDAGREAVGHGVLTPEEERVVPQGGLALEISELLAPLTGVLAEVDLGGAPVAPLPARVQVLVGDPVGGRANRYICTHGRNKCTKGGSQARGHPQGHTRHHRRARSGRRHASRRRPARRPSAVRHDLLVRLEGGPAPGDAAARRARGGRADRASRSRPRAARARRARVGACGVGGARRGPRVGPRPPRGLHRARARGNPAALARRRGDALAPGAARTRRDRPARRGGAGPEGRRAAGGRRDHGLHARAARPPGRRLRGARVPPSPRAALPPPHRGRAGVTPVARLAHREHGPEDGPVALLLHGYPESSYMWRDLMPAIADAGWRAIAPDLAGFGDSEPDPPGTWKRHVEAVERFRRELGIERCVLVVHDWGGLIGLRWACEHPEGVEALVISSTGFFPDGKWHGMATAMRTPGTGEQLVDGLDRDGFGAVLRGASPGLGDDALDEYWKAFADETRRRGQLELYRSGDFEKLAGYRLAELAVP